MLALDPSKRLTAEQAIQHPFFAGLRCPADEPDYPDHPLKDSEVFSFGEEQGMTMARFMNIAGN
jgi:serine/threonine protein kinase